ncbi:MAG TPA: FAD-dependent oxidoreductase, partial [Chthoniobacterales bacterium]
WSKVIKRSRDVSDKNAAGIEFLFRKNKVDYIRGEASLDKPGAVVVRLAGGKTETHNAANILIATGVVSRPFPGLPFNGKTVIGSREAMILDPQPKSMVIIGAGAIGVEFAYFYTAFGTKVTLVELLLNILPVEDTEVSQTLEKALTKQGIKILTQSKTTAASATGKSVQITVEGKTTEKISADVCLVAIGVTPLLPNGKLRPKLTERGLHRDERPLRNQFA